MTVSTCNSDQMLMQHRGVTAHSNNIDIHVHVYFNYLQISKSELST